MLCSTGRIDDAARALGMRSLDGAARLLGWDWTDASQRTRRGILSRSPVGVPKLERVEAIVNNPAIYELAELIPAADPLRGGRQRDYPEYMWLIYEALISVYGSARQVEAELSHPVVWDILRAHIRERFPRDMSRWLPADTDAPPPLPLRPQPLPRRPRRPRRAQRTTP